VTDPEPLPEGHPLWSAPNLVITPHIGGGTTNFMPNAFGLVGDQVRRLAAGEELPFRIDPSSYR
jgi:phosphoglycerate dehydrogenase-like enzyme